MSISADVSDSNAGSGPRAAASTSAAIVARSARAWRPSARSTTTCVWPSSTRPRAAHQTGVAEVGQRLAEAEGALRQRLGVTAVDAQLRDAGRQRPALAKPDEQEPRRAGEPAAILRGVDPLAKADHRQPRDGDARPLERFAEDGRGRDAARSRGAHDVHTRVTDGTEESRELRFVVMLHAARWCKRRSADFPGRAPISWSAASASWNDRSIVRSVRRDPSRRRSGTSLAHPARMSSTIRVAEVSEAAARQGSCRRSRRPPLSPSSTATARSTRRARGYPIRARARHRRHEHDLPAARHGIRCVDGGFAGAPL